MARRSLDMRKHCNFHPNRETDLVCERCKTPYCPECLTEVDGKKVCANCSRELAELEAQKLSFPERLRAEARRLATTGIFIIGLIALSFVFFFIFRNQFDRQISPEELARLRYAVSGSFQTEEGVNATSPVLGAILASATSDRVGHPSKQLINEFTGPDIPAWRSDDASFPQEIVISLESRRDLEKALFLNNPSEPPDSYPREVEILFSDERATEGFRTVARYTLAQSNEPQRGFFPLASGSWVKIRILSNYGSSDYTSLDEIGVYSIPRGMLVSPNQTPLPALLTPQPFQ